MPALKAHEVENFLRRGAKDFRCFLVYGPDTGLVSERCLQLSKFAGKDATIIKLEGDSIAADPALLMDEAYAISMFGGQRVLWLREGTKQFHDLLEPLLNEPPPDVTLLVEAGELRPNAALRKLFEASKNAVALPCYADDVRDLARLIDEELRETGLKIEDAARRTLVENLGGDRLATRQELKKLILYAHGQDTIMLEDVLAVSGDVSALALDGILDDLGLGETDHVIMNAQRHLSHGTHGSVLLTLALRHMLMLQLLRYEVDNGRTTTEAIKSASPPIFFKRQPKIERQLIIWPLEKIENALAILNDAVFKTRQLPHVTEALTERALMDVAMMARERAV
jgi:DNA polymerase-3 subunit delta